MIDTPDTAAAPADGAMTTEAAISALSAGRADPPAAAAPAEAAPAPETPSAGQAGTNDTGAETRAGVEPADTPEPAAPEVKAPAYWSKEAKARFAELPADLQNVVFEQDKGRESAAGKAKQDAAEARKAADTEAGTLKERNARLGQLLPQLEASMATKWDGVTPDVWVEAFKADPRTAALRKAEYDADMAKLETAKGEAAKADVEAHTEHVKALVAELPKVAPELADEKEGSKRLQETFGYLNSQGITNDQLRWVTAGQLAVARKAMLYDQGQTALATAPRTPPKPAAPPLRPASAASPSTQAPLVAAKQKLARSGSTEDAIAVLRASRNTE